MELKLPELGEGVHEGELVSWKVKAGDTVKDDQVVAEIMTDKATVELPAPFSGTITSLNAKEGQTVKVGQTILEYTTGASSATAKDNGAKTSVTAASPAPTAPKAAPAPANTTPVAAAKPASSAPAAGASAAWSAAGASAAASDSASVRAAPSTRRMAREMGVDLGMISGTGPEGRILATDLEKAARYPTAKVGTTAARTVIGSEEIERIPFKGLRKKIAEKMRLSKDHATHFTYVEEADATALVKLRSQIKELAEPKGIKMTYLPIVMKAMVTALKDFPILNAELNEETGEILIKKFYNIALSVQTEDGLTAPVIHHVENKGLLEIAQEIQNVVARARAKKLTKEDLTGGTITLTNAGSIGGLFATPIINYPEVAIVGLNKIFRKPVAIKVKGKEKIVVRDWTYFSISLDHRIVDGAVAAEFMKRMIQIIQNPALISL